MNTNDRQRGYTRIALQPPYSKDYRAGYLNTNSEPRRVVALVGVHGQRTSTSYARYLMSCKLGRYLAATEQVDHIDENKLNDSLENLQILSAKANNAKHAKAKGRKLTYLSFVCPICGRPFKREKRLTTAKIKAGKTLTCSRSCGGKNSHLTRARSSAVEQLTHNKSAAGSTPAGPTFINN